MRNGLVNALMIAALVAPAGTAAETIRSGHDWQVEVHTGPGSRLATERRVHVRTSPLADAAELQVVRGTAPQPVPVAAQYVDGCVPDLTEAPRLLDAAFRPTGR